LQRVLVLRIAPDNRQAIDFALDQMLSAPLGAQQLETKKRFEPTVLGIQVDSLLLRLDQSLAAGAGLDFEKTVADAIRNSGTDLVVESPERDRGADLAFWSDLLESFLGNPLLVEVKLRIKTEARAAEAFKQVGSYLALSAIGWALL